MQCHLVIRHLYYLGIEQWRDEVAWRAWNGHIKQPRLTNVASVCAALWPVFDNQVADIARRVRKFFRRQNYAVVFSLNFIPLRPTRRLAGSTQKCESHWPQQPHAGPFEFNRRKSDACFRLLYQDVGLSQTVEIC
jgi:hypothetical protein